MKTIRIAKAVPKAVSRGQEAVQSVLPLCGKKWTVSYHFKTGLCDRDGREQNMTTQCSGYYEWDALRALCCGAAVAGGVTLAAGMIRKIKKAAQTRKLKKEWKRKWLRRAQRAQCRPRLLKKHG